MTGDDADTFAVVTLPGDGEGAGDGGVSGVTIGAAFPADDGQTYASDNTSIDGVLIDSATLSLSPISDSPAETATLTVSGPVTFDDDRPVLVDPSGWWSISTGPGPVASFDTSAAYVAQADEATTVAATDVTALPSVTAIASGTGSVGGSLAPVSLAQTSVGALVVVAPSNDAPGSTVGSGAGSMVSGAGAVDPTVTIIGSPIEGTTLTASVMTSGFTGTTDLEWQRFYAGSWWNIPVELSPYSSGEVLTFVTTPTYVVREEDEEVSAIRVEATFVDTSGVTDAVVDSTSIGPITASPATISLSPITGSPVVGATLSVSGLVTSEDFTGSPTFNWQRYYSGGWWDIPVELSPYSAGESLTYVTTPTYVVRPEDEDVLAIRVEATYVDNSGQTFTAFSDFGTSGTELTIVEPPLLTAADVSFIPVDDSVPLAITDTAFDSEYTLGDVTISGVPSQWSLSGDGATNIGGGTWTVGSGDLGSLVLGVNGVGIVTVGVTASESASGPSGILTATATTSFVISITEPPSFSGPTSFVSLEGTTIALSGIVVTPFDDDDTLGNTVTVSGVSAGWTLFDGTTPLDAPGGVAMLPLADLGSLAILSPDNGGETDSLTLTATATDNGATFVTSTGSEVLTVAASGQAEEPTFGPTTTWTGDTSGITLSGLSVTPDDSDDTLTATLSGVPSGWEVTDPGVTTITGTSGGASGIIPVDDLGLLVVTPPHAGGSVHLTLTVTSSEDDDSLTGAETLTVSTTGGTEASAFGASAAAGTSFAIDLAGLAFASNMSLSYADNGSGGGTLTVNNGTQVVDLALLGQYAAAGFQAHSDPGGGTQITYSPQTSATEAASLTNPNH
jgi:hypothetical protein